MTPSVEGQVLKCKYWIEVHAVYEGMCINDVVLIIPLIIYVPEIQMEQQEPIHSANMIIACRQKLVPINRIDNMNMENNKMSTNEEEANTHLYINS